MEPIVSKSQAPRAALMKRLDSLLEKRIIYIHAPGGFGKTVSSLLWLEHRASLANIKRALVSLDVYDDKTTEFCRRFISALANLQPENTALRELIASAAFETTPVEITLQAASVFTGTQDNYVLLLDDLHVIKNDEIFNLLMVLYKRMSKNFTVLLLSRTAPPDNFSEIVAKGELAIVDTEDLQFTCGEIKDFFSKNGKHISNKEAEEILASTGGWAIGIRALLLSEEKSYHTKLTDRYLVNFLKTHIWERWDDRFKDFMMLVSVAEELTPELCDRLTADNKLLKKVSSAGTLVELMRENAFLRITGSNAYRFHDLFREFLLHMLEQAGGLNKQYNKAGKYFYDRKEYSRSVRYYLKAGNDDGVAKSIYHMYDYNSSYASVEDTLNTVQMSFSEALVKKHPFLLEAQAWCAYVEGRPGELENLLDEYYKALPKIILKSPRSAITQMFVRLMDHRIDFVDTLKKLRLVPFKGAARAYSPSLTQSLPHFHRSGRDFSKFYLDIENSQELARKTLGIVIGEEYPVMRECLYAGYHYERGNANEAHEYALAACAKMRDDSSPELKFCVLIGLTAALLADRQTEEAEKVLTNIENMIEQHGAFYLIPNFHAYKFTMKLTNGNRNAADEWLSLYSENPHNHLAFYKSYRHFTSARAYIVAGDYNMAILLLKKLLTFAESYNRTLDVIEALILLAVVYWNKGGRGLNIALDYLQRAVLIAHEYKYTQLFANEGPELTTMLHKLQKRAQHSSYSVPAEFVKTLYIATVAEAKHSKGLTGGRTPDNLKFTDKQKDVMRLMCEGYSRNEIAQKMGLKPNGVKSHTTLIYNKLNVPSSIEAILKIKELGLLDG